MGKKSINLKLVIKIIKYLTVKRLEGGGVGEQFVSPVVFPKAYILERG